MFCMGHITKEDKFVSSNLTFVKLMFYVLILCFQCVKFHRVLKRT